MAFTKSLGKFKEYVERVKASASRAKEHAEKAMGVGIAAVEIGGTSAALGYAHERYGTADKDGDMVYTVASVDVDLGLGVASHAAGFFGAAGKYAEHVHNIGNGGIAAYGYRQGAKYGRQALRDSKSAPATKGMHAGAWGRVHEEQAQHANARRF
jgi:hypothetical protein